jgi:hypothetical protein
VVSGIPNAQGVLELAKAPTTSGAGERSNVRTMTGNVSGKVRMALAVKWSSAEGWALSRPACDSKVRPRPAPVCSPPKDGPTTAMTCGTVRPLPVRPVPITRWRQHEAARDLWRSAGSRSAGGEYRTMRGP